MHDEFPISIDLSIKPPKGVVMMGGKKGDLKPMYPSLYISGADGLESLPREGYALIHFKRRSITMGERDDEACCSADLEVHEIRLPEKDSGEDMGDMADALKSMAAERGLIEGSEEEEGEEEEPSEDAESLAAEMGEDEDEE